ncbi:hypothetical protein HELRODRAFT_168744 [Helobdella robusta]|uniref:Uncharacterized protein n=1 Tax=Helobdella robusta TaxID=6412 RepID=T1F0W9_HELRO|nr:hypothetical protein HELRODRAFT_168744 [Helobdella robusta]ESO08833.1 hypothetical protein HELRODRAFT_168744 [Helobdella robusta]
MDIETLNDIHDDDDDDNFPPLPATLPPFFNVSTKTSNNIFNKNTEINEVEVTRDENLPLVPSPLTFDFKIHKELNNDVINNVINDEDDDEGFPLPPPEELLSPRMSVPTSAGLMTAVSVFTKENTIEILKNIVSNNESLNDFNDKLNIPNVGCNKTSVSDDITGVNRTVVPIEEIANNNDISIISVSQSFANVQREDTKTSSLRDFHSPAPFKLIKNPSFSSTSMFNLPFINKFMDVVDNNLSVVIDSEKEATINLESISGNVAEENPLSIDKNEYKADEEKDSGIFSGSEIVKLPELSPNNFDASVENEVFVNSDDVISFKKPLQNQGNTISSGSTNGSSNRSYDSAMKKLTNCQLNDVLKDYYKDDETSNEIIKNETETENVEDKKPQKPLIAQALLPKNQRLTSESGQNNVDPSSAFNKQSFNVTLNELKSFLNPETGVKGKLKSADDFYLGKITKKNSSSEQDEKDLESRWVDNNKTTLTKNVSTIVVEQKSTDNNQIISFKNNFNDSSLLNKNLISATPTNNISEYAYNNTSKLTTMELNANNTAPKQPEKLPKLSKSVSLKSPPGQRPKVPNVKGFTEEQIQQLLESQKSQNQNKTSSVNNDNISTFQGMQNKNVSSTETKVASPNVYSYSKTLENNFSKFSKISNDNDNDVFNANINTENEKNKEKRGEAKSPGAHQTIELNLRSKKLFFEQISTQESDQQTKKRGDSADFKLKPSFSDSSYQRNKVFDKGSSIEDELKLVLEKKIFHGKDNEEEINKFTKINSTPRSSSIDKSTIDGLNNEDSVNAEGKDAIFTPPVSETKAFFESKNNGITKPLKPQNVTNVTLKKSSSLLDKSAFHRMVAFKPEPKLIQKSKNVNNERSLGIDAHTKYEQETVETLVNKYKILHNKPLTERKIHPISKSVSVDQKVSVPDESEKKKLPGKSLASLNVASNVLGAKTWSATLKAYAQKSNK